MCLVPLKRFRSVSLSLFALLVLLSLFVSGCSGNPGFGRKNVVEKKTEHTYAAGMDKFILNNRNGNISINVWDKNEVKVEVVRRLKGYESAQSLEEQLQDFKLEDNQNNGTLILDAGYTGPLKNVDGLMEITIYTPNIVKSVDANLALGNLFIKDLTGTAVKAELNIGNIELTKFEGRVDADINTGNVRLVSGKLLDGTVLRTYIGTIDLKGELDERGKYQFYVNMGNAELKFPASSNIVAAGKNNFFANDFSDRKEGAQLRVDCEMGRVTIRKY